MNLKPYPLALLALLAASSAHSQTTKAPTRPDSTVCIPGAAARRIDADLQRYRLGIAENHRLRDAVQASTSETRAVRHALAAKDSVVASVGDQLVGERMLRSHAEGEGAVWKAKAKKRWWIIVGETALVIAGVVLAGSR
jgi:hypothetical protein